LELHGLALTAENDEIIRIGLGLARYDRTFEEILFRIQITGLLTQQAGFRAGYMIPVIRSASTRRGYRVQKVFPVRMRKCE